jgi:glycosyltransferase involved in cell wall biosynthesis
MINNILITIAIPTYNNEKIIQKAISSCLNQETNETYEILIVNNASEDNTESVIAQNINDKIKVITNDQTVSLWENHNVCLKNASGKYIIFCHSDDTLEKHAITTITKKIKERNFPDKYILWGHSMFRDFSPNIRQAGFSMNEMIVGQYAPLIFMHGGLTPSGTCYSRKPFLDLGGFLKTNHRIAPSDLTTMQYLALDGFRFEMLDEMIFMRTDASTLVSETGIDDNLNARDDAFQQLLQTLNSDQIDNLLDLSLNLEIPPYLLYYGIAQDSRYKKRIQKILTGKITRHPLLLRSKLVQKLLLRLMSK